MVGKRHVSSVAKEGARCASVTWQRRCVGRQWTMSSCAEFMAEEPPALSSHKRKPKGRAGSLSPQPSRSSGGRSLWSGRKSRSAQDASYPCTPMCAALFCCPFSGGALIPLLRSPSSASDGPSGEAAGIEANKRRLTLDLASTLQRWAEGLAVKGVSMRRSGQTAVNREADEGRGPFLGAAMRHSRHAP